MTISQTISDQILWHLNKYKQNLCVYVYGIW